MIQSKLPSNILLGNLPLQEFQVDKSTLASVVAHRFRQDANLPGVIITDGDKIAGVLSRQSFIERMSRPYGPELHLRRPIQLLLPFIESASLALLYTCKIDEAVRRALMRPTNCAYDPIAVVFPNNRFRLLDVRTLILAQSRILAIAHQSIHQKQQQLQESLEILEHERRAVEQQNRLLEIQKISIEDRNQLLEKQQVDLMQKTQKIRELNQRFIQISQILSIKGEEAFEATFEGVDTISNNTEKMIAIGRSLTEHLETVRDASGLVRKVSHDAHHLATQVAILVNNYGAEFSGFSRIASDIGKLSSQAFDAGRRVDEMTNRLKTRTGDLTQIARQGAIEARALLLKVSRAEAALSELEKLVAQHDEALPRSQFSFKTMHNLAQATDANQPAKLDHCVRQRSSNQSTSNHRERGQEPMLDEDRDQSTTTSLSIDNEAETYVLNFDQI
jgi:hypothetical protein